MTIIRLFVGCSANGEDAEAQAMLEYTLRKHHQSGEIVHIEWMMLTRDPASPWYSDSGGRGWQTKGWATPFSAFRWAIPHACKYQGKAIYTDVDKIFMAPIAELWNQKIPDGKCMLTKDEKHSCVILWDCERAKKFLPDIDKLRSEGFYRNVRNNIGSAAGRFQGNWNCLDGESYPTLTNPDIKIIHFTKVETQPHLKWALPRLRKQGKEHWNKWTLNASQPHPHKRQDVAPLVDVIWQGAQEAGYTAEKYEALATNFGRYDAVRGAARAA